MDKEKECKKCNEILDINEFSKVNKGRGYSSYCKGCHSKSVKESRDKKFIDNPAWYLLRESCEKAFSRGKPEYKRSGYEGIGCAYKSVNEFAEILWNDEAFRTNWINQTKIYCDNKKAKKYRPTLDRIDSSKDYVLENLKVSPLGKNSYDANVKACQVFVISLNGIDESHEFPSVTEAKKSVKEKFQLPQSRLTNIDNGGTIELKDGRRILFKSKNGDLVDTEQPKYLCIVNKKRILYDQETGEDVSSITVQTTFQSSGIRIQQATSM